MYFRSFNTNAQGQAFAELQKLAVWSKAQIIDGYDPTLLRKDVCGAWIRWEDYGDTSKNTGWEVDHIHPVARGGTDSIGNLQALQWQNNRNKSDRIDLNYCAVTAVA